MAKDIVVEKSIVINKPKHEVFQYLKLARNQENFSVWNMADPHKKTEVKGTDGTVGFVYSWDSANKNVGAGAQEIKNIVDESHVEYEIRFERPMKNIAQSRITTKDAGNGQTQVTWDFRGPTKFPMSLFKGMFQKMLGKDLEKSLGNLKELLEK